MRKPAGTAAVIAAGIVLTLNSTVTVAAQASIPRSAYLDYARESADATWDRYDELIERWQEGFDPESVFGYRAPGGLLEMALIYSWLFEHEGGREHARRAKRVLLEYGDYRSAFPESAIEKRPDYLNGVPALPDFFTAMRYIRAFDTMNRLDQLSAREVGQCRDLIAHSMEYLLQTAEWGTMNRTALRAETLAWAVRALPDHERTPVWEMQRKALGDDNWGNWEIEDATIYHGVWLYALMGYASAREDLAGLFRTPEIYYYAHYFLNLMCPYGIVPDFGDANWTSNWRHYLVFFQVAAAIYDDPEFKWAAERIARRFVDFSGPANVGLGVFLLDCYRWGSDEVVPETPTAGSMEVMEDVQGKKIVFRDGWQEDSTWMLLNYRDEGDGGLNFRDYLRDTIPVEEEKMTHGHADENSIVLLMSGGSVLLHDGGYRDFMPSGPFGAYRQDYFHNRICVRPEKIFMGQVEGEARYDRGGEAVPGQGILEFMRNAGSYREVRTRKVDFITLPDIDYSRSRMIDDKWGYEWDRVIAWVKEPNVFVVFDIVKSRVEEYFTIANLWHTRKIVSRGEHWYDTVYDRIQNTELPTDTHLLIHFPDQHFRLEGTEPIRRHYQDEIMIHQTTAHHFELGETEAFVTVLVPHDASDSPEEWVSRIRLADTGPGRSAKGVVIEWEGREYIVGVKNDLRQDMARDWRRPRYTWEAGRIQVESFETNGDFIYGRREGTTLDYTIVNLTRALWNDQLLYQGKPGYFGLAYDGTPVMEDYGKSRYWRAKVDIGR